MGLNGQAIHVKRAFEDTHDVAVRHGTDRRMYVEIVHPIKKARTIRYISLPVGRYPNCVRAVRIETVHGSESVELVELAFCQSYSDFIRSALECEDERMQKKKP